MLHLYRHLKVTKRPERRRIIFVNVHTHHVRNTALAETITNRVCRETQSNVSANEVQNLVNIKATINPSNLRTTLY